LIRVLNRYLAPGVYVRYCRPVIKKLHEKVTIYSPLAKYIDKAGNEKVQWVGEFYQVFWVLTACLLFVFSRETSITWLIGIVLIYRIYELLLFVLNWLLIEKDPPHNTRRSLVGFLLIAFEMVILFAAAYSSHSCYPGRRQAIYNALTTFVTIGPRSEEKINSSWCFVLGTAEIIFAYTFTILIIGTVASVVVADTIQKRDTPYIG
jgi:hypothetical protein